MRELLNTNGQWPVITTPMLAKLLPKRLFSAAAVDAEADAEDEVDDLQIDEDAVNETETADVVAAMAREWLSRAPPSGADDEAKASSSPSLIAFSPTVTDDSGRVVYKSTLCSQLSQAAKATLRSSNDRLKRVQLSGDVVSMLASNVKGANDADGSRIVAGDWVACLFSPGGGKRFWSLGELVAIRRTDGRKDTVRDVEWSLVTAAEAAAGLDSDDAAIGHEDLDARFPFSLLCLWLKKSNAAAAEDPQNKDSALRHLFCRDDEVTDHVEYPLSSILLRIDATDVQYHRGDTGFDEQFSISQTTHAAVTAAFDTRCAALAKKAGGARKSKATEADRAASRVAAQTYALVSSAPSVVTSKGRTSRPVRQLAPNT